MLVCISIGVVFVCLFVMTVCGFVVECVCFNLIVIVFLLYFFFLMFIKEERQQLGLKNFIGVSKALEELQACLLVLCVVGVCLFVWGVVCLCW